MDKLKIGIDGHEFSNWSGGIDFIATISEALQATGCVQTILILEKRSLIEKLWALARCIVKSKGSLLRFKQLYIDSFAGNKNVIESFKTCSGETSILTYKKTETKLFSNREAKLAKCLIKNEIKLLLPSISCETKDFPVPRIGYIFDFQHKYYPNSYSKADLRYRNTMFSRQIRNSKYLLVNAYSVKEDIDRFYPRHDCKIIVLPFKPFQCPVCGNLNDLNRYKLPDKYFVICNQFWMHKSHRTAFEALELLYKDGYDDIHIVCTGKMQDYRNPDYINNLKTKIDSMECKKNIHIIGFVPKKDQMLIMKKSVGLIQPTLFEGGPGGGATYNAICLGLTCILSDIPVNKEASGYERAYYFEKENSKKLAQLMLQHWNDVQMDEDIINDMIEENKKNYGMYLLNKLEGIINEKENSITK